MKTLVLISFMLLCLAGVSQETPAFKARYLEMSYPGYYNYDGRFKFSIPIASTGIKFAKTFENQFGYHISISSDLVQSYDDAEEFGDVVGRYIIYPSFGMSRKIIKTQKFEMSGYLEVNHRFGQINWLAAKNWFETVLESTYLVDFGTSAGINLRYKPKEKCFLSFDLKESYYIYRYDNGYEPYGLKGSPRNVLTCYFGFGFNF